MYFGFSVLSSLLVLSFTHAFFLPRPSSNSFTSLDSVSRKSANYQRFSHKGLVKLDRRNETTGLLEFLQLKFQVKRTLAKQWLCSKLVWVNYESRSQFDYTLRNGDVVTVLSSQYISSHRNDLPVGVHVLYDDEHILAVEKPSGIPLTGSEENSISSMIQRYFIRQRSKQRAWLVGNDLEVDLKTNGTDMSYWTLKESSGIVLFAKTNEARSFLRKNWSDFGLSFVMIWIGTRLGSHGSLKSAMGETQYRVLSTSTCHDSTLAMVEVTSPPGCTQRELLDLLRDNGIEVAGDSSSRSPLGRLCLHLSEMRLTHPTSRDLLTLQSHIPESFNFLMERKLPSENVSKQVDDFNSNVESVESRPRNVKVLTLEEFLGTK